MSFVPPSGLVSGINLPLAVVDRLFPMVMILDTDGRVIHAAPTILKMLRLGNEDLSGPLGQVFSDLVRIRRPKEVCDYTALRGQVGARLSLVLRGHDDMPMRGVVDVLPDGGAILDISLGLSFERAVSRFSLTLRDFAPTDQTIELLYLNEAKSATTRLSESLSERLQAAHSVAQFQARTDVLTGLSNRRAMDQELEHLLNARGQDFSLMHLDLDHFKEVNDTHGHAAGDLVLKEVGAILDAELRRNDFPARIGGDEFLIILRPSQSAPVLARVASRLIDRIERPISLGRREARISCSIGIVSSTQYENAPSIGRLMADADAALYRAKKEGRGRFVIFDPERFG